MKNLDVCSVKELLVLYSAVLQSLKDKKIIRTNNNPVGDLSEQVFSAAFNWKKELNSHKGYDCTDSKGNRIQIKGRQSDANTVRLSAIRDRDFDILAVVVFGSHFNIRKAVLLPISSVIPLFKHQDLTNSDIINLNLKTVDKLAGTQDVTDIVSAAFDTL